MPGTSGSHIVQLGDSVYGLSNLVSLDKPRTWVAPDARGFDPCTCYVVVDGDEAHLIDTGLRIHGEEVVRQLGSIISAETPLHVVTTRIEPDALGSIDMIADNFNVVRLSGQTNVIPLNYLGPLYRNYPQIEVEMGLGRGNTITFGNGRTLEAVEPIARTLPTLWFYDAHTKTLFSSDFFGGLHLPAEGAWDATPAETIESAQRHMLAKFDWFAIADKTMILDRLDGIVDRLEIENIAPGHGLWTIGAENVRRRFELTRTAIETIPRESYARSA